MVCAGGVFQGREEVLEGKNICKGGGIWGARICDIRVIYAGREISAENICVGEVNLVGGNLYFVLKGGGAISAWEVCCK